MPYHYILGCLDLARTFTIRTNIVKFKSLFTSQNISTKKKLCTVIRCITKSHPGRFPDILSYLITDYNLFDYIS